MTLVNVRGETLQRVKLPHGGEVSELRLESADRVRCRVDDVAAEVVHRDSAPDAVFGSLAGFGSRPTQSMVSDPVQRASS